MWSTTVNLVNWFCSEEKGILRHKYSRYFYTPNAIVFTILTAIDRAISYLGIALFLAERAYSTVLSIFQLTRTVGRVHQLKNKWHSYLNFNNNEPSSWNILPLMAEKTTNTKWCYVCRDIQTIFGACETFHENKRHLSDCNCQKNPPRGGSLKTYLVKSTCRYLG